jgi:shikimate dehydrogenase
MHYYRLGLIGWPVAHSLSPLIHQLALQACGLEGGYRLYPLEPQHFDEKVTSLIEQLRNKEMHGINVTVPHKQRVLAYTDRLTTSAKLAGAVNTLYLEEGLVVGDNTDIPGFWMDLERLGWAEKRSGLAHSHNLSAINRAIILGAGGAARGVAVALADHGWQVGLAARRNTQSQTVATELKQALNQPVILALPLDQDLMANFGNPVTLIVNATSAGMSPQIDVDPWPERIPLPPGVGVYDLVYNPPQTRLLQRANTRGLPTANGLGMLVAQAVLSFKRWTMQMPTYEAILNEVRQQMDSNYSIHPLQTEN